VTLIPPETELRTVSESGETATINLGCTAESSETPDCGVLALQDVSQRVLFGQLVCTADAVPGISGVRLQHEGRALDAPLPDAASTAEPVRCFDYEPLFARDRDDRSSGSSD
jgi:Sporulation and spore germination